MHVMQFLSGSGLSRRQPSQEDKELDRAISLSLMVVWSWQILSQISPIIARPFDSLYSDKKSRKQSKRRRSVCNR